MSTDDEPDGVPVGDEFGGGGGVTVYWRPGCGFCAVLRRRLRATGIPYAEVNIWDDPAAAAYVRSVAGGNETVPTVTVGTVALVNPTAKKVTDVVRRTAPELIPDQPPPPPRRFFGLLPGRSTGRPTGSSPADA